MKRSRDAEPEVDTAPNQLAATPLLIASNTQIHSCLECHRKFPTRIFLELHIDENHNPFNKIKQAQGTKIFKCFLFNAGCDKVCSTPKKRRLHMIDKHHYPSNFDWSIINRGI